MLNVLTFESSAAVLSRFIAALMKLFETCIYSLYKFICTWYSEGITQKFISVAQCVCVCVHHGFSLPSDECVCVCVMQSPQLPQSVVFMR